MFNKYLTIVLATLLFIVAQAHTSEATEKYGTLKSIFEEKLTFDGRYEQNVIVKNKKNSDSVRKKALIDIDNKLVIASVDHANDSKSYLSSFIYENGIFFVPVSGNPNEPWIREHDSNNIKKFKKELNVIFRQFLYTNYFDEFIDIAKGISDRALNEDKVAEDNLIFSLDVKDKIEKLKKNKSNQFAANIMGFEITGRRDNNNVIEELTEKSPSLYIKQVSNQKIKDFNKPRTINTVKWNQDNISFDIVRIPKSELKRFDRPIFGILFSKISDHFYITGIFEGTPAANSKLASGQRIISLNGIDVSDLKQEDVVQLLATADVISVKSEDYLGNHIKETLKK